MRTFLALAFVCGNVICADKPDHKSLESRFYRSWLAVEVIERGVSTKEPDQLYGTTFSKDAHYSWGRRGELSAGAPGVGPRIDTVSDPMKVDFINDEGKGKDGKTILRVLPCIFKFEGNKLVIASGTQWTLLNDKKAGEDYQGRPTKFESTKTNGVRVVFFEPCSHLDQD